MTIHEIASIVNGEVVGNAKHTITKPSKIEEANSDSITFLANTKYLDYINTTEAGCIVISKELFSGKFSGNFIIVNDAYAAFTKVLSFLMSMLQQKFQTKHTYIHQPKLEQMFIFTRLFI
jgi:UDP-3-O-[3-hydroxymyristoyl] glucosamine N-acyltransferase